MIYATHIPKRERKRALRDVYALEPVAPKFNPWSSCPITFDRRDHPTSIRHGGFAALVLDPIIDGFHLTRGLMDGGSNLNLLYQDTVHKMGIDPSRIKPTKTTFKGVIPGVEAHCTGSVTLEVVFGSPDNFRSEELIFDIVPFRVAITHCSGELHLRDSMRYCIMHTSSSRCQDLGGSSQSMETQSALSTRRSTLRPSQQKRKAASQGNPPIRRFKTRTPSSVLGVIGN